MKHNDPEQTNTPGEDAVEKVRPAGKHAGHTALWITLILAALLIGTAAFLLLRQEDPRACIQKLLPFLSEQEAEAAPLPEEEPDPEAEDSVTEEAPPAEELPEEDPPEEEPGRELVTEIVSYKEIQEELAAAESEEQESSKPTSLQTQILTDEIRSDFAILIRLEDGSVLAEKDPDGKIYPASMTKVMTALVACEQITDWSADFRMTQDIIDPLYLSDASLAGFVHDELVNVMDLVYGAILPSGAEATTALALTAAESEAEFAKLMNEKVQELELENTHFLNASGLHHEGHYTTVRDMAAILQAALANPRCFQVLTSADYTTAVTEKHPEGLYMFNKFLQRCGEVDQQGAVILGAKTGYTEQAGNCCASYGLSPDGTPCICVTAHCDGSMNVVKDHILLYSQYAE